MVLLAIWPRDFNELINAADAWDVVRYEGLELAVQLYVMRLVSAHQQTHVHACQNLST